ncbi:CzcA family heavy metal efflux pump [Alicycliphilus sp. B1]|nr:CzcA family heavy metal efflux pump [Alicycliphilus sp. B1]
MCVAADLASFLNDAQAVVQREMKFDPKRIQLMWGGQFENLGARRGAAWR